jgi:peptide deformylase
MKAENYFTHIDTDPIYLRTKLLDVNMRLFKTSPDYQQIVLDCCAYIKCMALMKMDDYKSPHGMSGANLAIPFNIIAVVRKRGTSKSYAEIMINPTILHAEGKDEVIAMSNCGSIRLDEPIPVKRHAGVLVSWYTEEGKRLQGVFRREDGGFTIQHEIDHNNGVLITDRQHQCRHGYVPAACHYCEVA